jgi:hypothetical protein
VQLAIPDESIVEEHMADPPSRKVTLPVGTAAAAPDSFAVNTTLAPAADGFKFDVKTSVVGCTTLSFTAAEVETAWFPSPRYAAEILCGPNDSEVTVSVATPFASGAAPSTEVPSMKLIVPLAWVELATWAVKVTLSPRVAGFRFDATVVLVGASRIITVLTEEVELALLLSPEYVAVIECVPTIRFEIEKLNCPAPETGW